MSRPRLLVIDDDATFRNLLVSLLRKDYIVFVAADGLEGFQKAGESPPDLAVIDVQMPRLDGLKTLQAFRVHPHLKSVPVIMLTGDASRETVVAAVQAGATDYIIKTVFTKDDLIRKIRRALESRPQDNVRPAEAAPAVSPDPHTKRSTTPELQAVLDSWE
jgi:CheY-like chemotaxis protein